MSPLTIALLCTGLLLLVIILWVIVSHNGFVRLRNLVQEAWRQIDVELNRRHDLIPNLLETVRGYMSYEQSTLQAVVEARRLAEAPAANLAQRARNEDALSGALSRLIALSENYPTLRADSSFLQLQQELTNTEDRIAAGRRFYNSNVRDLNTKCEKFPSLIIASIFHFRHAEYFEVHDEASRAVPQVSFGGQPQPGQAAGDHHPQQDRRKIPQVVQGAVYEQLFEPLQGGEAPVVPVQGQIEQNCGGVEGQRPLQKSARAPPAVPGEKVPADHEEKRDRDPGQHPGEPEVGLRGQSGQRGGVVAHRQERRQQAEAVQHRDIPAGAHGSPSQTVRMNPPQLSPESCQHPAGGSSSRTALGQGSRDTRAVLPLPSRQSRGDTSRKGTYSSRQSPCSSISWAWGAPT